MPTRVRTSLLASKEVTIRMRKTQRKDRKKAGGNFEAGAAYFPFELKATALRWAESTRSSQCLSTYSGGPPLTAT